MTELCIKNNVFTLLTIILLCSAKTNGEYNVAFGKSVSLSSVHTDSVPDSAVNGVKTGQWDDGCASTEDEHNPWMILDLAEEYLISSIFIQNRVDCCPGRLSKLHIEIGVALENLTEVIYHPAIVDDYLNVSLSTALAGRYVKLWLEKINYLTICEIEVFCQDESSGWREWSEWSPCSRSCRNGTSSRHRSCNKEQCCGEYSQKLACNSHPCPDEYSYITSGDTSCSFDPRDCQDIVSTWSGIYHVVPLGTYSGLDVFCDMQTDGGGWLVFQRRDDFSVNFDRNWKDYLSGFGQINGTYWLGLRPIKAIVSQGDYELRIDIEDFQGHRTYAKYELFDIGDTRNQYKLNVDGYSGDAGDILSLQCGSPFSTRDRDLTEKQCTKTHEGAWWFTDCDEAQLNGKYQSYNLTRSEMKIKRK